ncbi:MAG: hypothetical protein KA403_08795 [Candidatus Omnitrophica bacterium]|nr:hypothetical protein [Candidatus Omnitrophota bacterium]
MDNSNIKLFCVDLLCWSSAFKAVMLARHIRPGKIYYINVSRFFTPFIPFLEKTIKTPLVQISDIVASEEKLEGVSLYETTHARLEDVLNAWLGDEAMLKSNAVFCADNGIHPDKFAMHLREAAIPHLYRPIEMSVLAEYLGGKDGAAFIMRRTPFSNLLGRCFEKVVFYRTMFAHALPIENRSDFFYDGYFNRYYFAGRLRIIGRFLYRWFNDLAASIMSRPERGDKNPAETKIGVELTQSRVRLDEINDISWIEGSGIPADQICGLEMERFDAESVKALKGFNIPRIRLNVLPWKPKEDGVKTVSVALRYSVSTFLMVLGLVKCLMFWNEGTWLRFQAVRYIYRSLYWMSVYEQLGIKVLWTMYDVDEDKLVKGQAIEWLGGLYTGGHWSNYPMYRVDNQKCYDVLFTWGEHFVRNNFNRYAFMAIFFTGYPCDYYFKSHRDRAKAIRRRYEGKFILSYQDNVMANDLPYSKNMQIDIHKVLISLLRKFENVVVLLKPKRKVLLDEVMKELPELKELIEQGRIEVFLGETLRTKAVPSEIGMASDLVIGLGVSTAAAEAFFAGTVAFHADLTCFERNEFANRGDGIVVFRDLFNLEKAVIQRITGTNKWRYEDYKGHYVGLDPFMDESSSKRMGYLIKRMREYLAQGVSREDLLPKLSRDYDTYLVSLANWQKMSWN